MVSMADGKERLELWHDRLGHPGRNAFNALFRHAQWPMKKLDLRLPEDFQCESCVKGKLTRKSFRSSNNAPSREWLVGERAHSDIWGPYAVKSYSGKRYFAAFVDEASRFVTLFLLAERSEIYEKFGIYYEYVRTQLNVRMKDLQMDNAKEYTKLGGICKTQYGMTCSPSIKHTPEQNGVAERMNRTITERMRCLLNHFQLPQELWAEAAVTATYYVNIVPNSTRDMEVPYAVWYREQPPYSRLRTFGCAVLAYIDKVERRKMDSKAREAIFVGYSRERRGYRLLDSNTREAYYSHTVVFHEKKAGRIAKGATPELVSDVSTQQYLGIDSATMETIPSMLDEAHPNERCDSESSAVGSEHQNLPGGADGARSASSGGAAEEARSGGAVATEVAVENTRSGGTVVTRSGGAVATQKRKRSAEGAGSVEVRGTESQEENRSQADHLRGEDVPPDAATSKPKRKKRKRSGRSRKSQHYATRNESPAIVRSSSSSKSHAIETVSSEMAQPSDGSSTGEGVKTSPCRALREFVPPEDASTKDYPVTRSGRTSKPPPWFGDYIHVAYSSTNTDDYVSASASWEKVRGEMQREMAKQHAIAWWQDYCCLTMGVIHEPETINEARKSEYSVQWSQAAQKEYDALMKNCTWELVPREKYMKVLRNRWVFRVKYLADGNIDRFKARLVIKGFMQVMASIIWKFTLRLFDWSRCECC
ncbi:hypothetical protein PF007_g29092 [Phytophthora fragariae]|uniref:Integrase catalytic domain-containing protein n=2 Tax=Phytophthora TaxID=4783 RepID=A0A6A3H6K7_9STRA|nr:hypothetical protein PF003_g10593 [Phytophthora fragariae]KAE8964777.1 hypothetical protein PF011_g28543 [Phytophthora fragariae]KAE9064713.1 hypothetical protein PF007_g29092 [Phytophthora fragariae]KAE9078066.1 hypothetical protein PF006_g27790 [Phytophthora fragariae]